MFMTGIHSIRSANNTINETVVCQDISNVVQSRHMGTKRRTLTNDELDDIERLRALVEEKKASAGLTQTRLAELCGWESQGTVAQYLGGHVGLNLEAAYRLAKALEVQLDSISPRLAAKAVELFGATQAALEPPQTIEALIATLQDDLDNEDNDVRMAIAELVHAYKNDPDRGKEIARSIRVLLGKL